MFYQPEGREKKQWKAATLCVGKLPGKIMYLRTDVKIKNTPSPVQRAEVTLIIPPVRSIGVKVKHKRCFNGKTDKSQTAMEREITVHQKERHFGVGE